MIKKLVLIFISLFLLFSCNEEEPSDYSVSDNFDVVGTTESISNETISILSFNIQIFGRAKASKPEVMDILVDIIDDYDLVAIQEIRDASGEAIQDLMILLPLEYELVLGPREGRSRSKEQYAFIYDSTVLTAGDSFVYDDPNDVFERNPHSTYFTTHGNFDFVIINKHVAPGDADAEIYYTPQVVEVVSLHFEEEDVIIVGDFNADGSYFNEEELDDVFNPSDYEIIVSNDTDTTVAANDYTYDRIIITDDVLEDYTGSWGVFNFETHYDYSLLSIEPKEVSDHYPVWAEFFINRDTD